VLDDESSNVSMGERQLITIARAFLARPAILILDEATSSVDTRTEVLIQRAMNSLRRGRTSFVSPRRWPRWTSRLGSGRWSRLRWRPSALEHREPAWSRATLRVVHSSPVFADPSGRRRRKMRLLGVGAGLAIAAALALITVGLAGGPKAPFISWELPRQAGAQSGQHPATAGHTAVGQAGSSAPSAVAPAGTRSPSPSADPQPSPSADRQPSPSPSASSSPSPSTSTATPTPTNPAGKTPPGQTRTSTPNPHKSTHGP
jgi:ABC transporter